MVEILLHALLAQTVVLALAALAVGGLQAVVLRRLGASAAYLAWLLVPAAMLAAALPRPAAVLVVPVDVSTIAPAWAVAGPVAAKDPGSGLAATLAVTWIAGALLLAALLALRQRRFESTLSRAPGVPARLPAGAGPAVLGLLRPRIVLPRDFESAFDAQQRRLMLLHEQVHLRRRDNLWNLLASALLVLHWFNPIAWWAARRLRADQELACDAAVLRQESSDALAAYAGALLKVQGVALPPPLATAWQSSHPFVERVRMLQLHRLSPARHRAGLHVAALSILVAGFGGYALRAVAGAPPAAGGSVLTTVDLQVDAGARTAARLLTKTGERATLRIDPDAAHPGAPVELAYTVTRLDANQLRIDTTVRVGDPLKTIASPQIVARDGEAASVRVRTDDGAHELALSFVPRVLRSGAAPAPLAPVPPLNAAPPLPPLDAPAAPAAVPPTSALPAPPAVPPTSALPAPPSDLPAPPPPQRAL